MFQGEVICEESESILRVVWPREGLDRLSPGERGFPSGRQQVGPLRVFTQEYKHPHVHQVMREA